MNYNHRDLEIMTRTLFGEIRGYSLEDQMAVAWVIRNRANRNHMPFMAGPLVGQEGAIERVCLYPWQFSCWNENDPNRKIIEDAPLGSMSQQLTVARNVLNAAGDDPTQGADHYYTEARPTWAKTWPPSWAQHYARTVQVGPHIFHDSRRVLP